MASASTTASSSTTAATTAKEEEEEEERAARADRKALADVEGDGWMAPLHHAVVREGGTLKCHPSARPDGTRGVRAVKQYWRRGDISSYDDDDDGGAGGGGGGGGRVDVVSEAVSSAVASKTSHQNTLHHVSSFLRRHRRRRRRDDDDDADGRSVTTTRNSEEFDEDDDDDGAVAISITSAITAAAAAAADDDAAVVDAARHHEEHPVLRALSERMRGGSKPGARCDGYRIGLAVEGGGMRGVISAGATGEVLRMGFADCFDAVYGSSAGAMAGLVVLSFVFYIELDVTLHHRATTLTYTT